MSTGDDPPRSPPNPEVASDPAARAGWYDDPSGRYDRRWWDGARWTAYAADRPTGGVVWDEAPFDGDGAGEPDTPGLPGLVTAFAGMAVGVGLAVGGVVLLEAAGEPGGAPVLDGASALLLWAGLLAACVVVSRRRGSGSVVRDFALRFQWRDIGLGLAGAIAGRLVATGAAVVVSWPFPTPTRRLTDTEEEIFEGLTQGPAEIAVLLAITCIGAPLVEELFFRGLLQGRLVGRLGIPLGIGLTSLLFGAAHLGNWEGSITFVYAFSIGCGGVVLGLMRHYSGRLGPPIAAHFFFNAQAMTLILLTA